MHSLSPSAVTVFLACDHATTLALRVARGELEVTPAPNPQADLAARKGIEHERAFLARLRTEGRTIAEVSLDSDTETAMRAGVDVVYQAAFVDDGWRGVADFLLRTEQPSTLGAWSYEALDTKLARSVRPSHILQLCFYDEQVARIQGRAPDRAHVLLGSGERVSIRPDEFRAYARRVRARLEAFTAAGPATEPYPNDHCGVCDFRALCEAWWDEVDHPCRVAGIRREQVALLAASGITTLAALGRAPSPAVSDSQPGTELATPPPLAAEAFAKIRQQAELQLWAREHGRDRFVLLPPQAGAGLALLPDPSPGDLFFDFEGDPFWDGDGSLEYLWGILDADRRFTPLHAHDRETERLALETFVDLVIERRRRFPDLHVYHYASYEITALRRIARRDRTREAALDELLDGGVFVDLYAVVRNGVRASRPGYGLKQMEAFLDFERRAELQDGGTSIVLFEEWIETGEQRLLDLIAAYNEEDCLATLLLRDWLLERRAEALAAFGPFPEQEPAKPAPVSAWEAERASVRRELLDAGEDVMAALLDRVTPGRALFDLARSLLAGTGRYPALEAILRREPHPSVQVIQAPPGSGRAEVCARLGAGPLDHLVIEDAERVSLADALAAGTTARAITLIGDPQQLIRPVDATQPRTESVLQHLIGDAQTIPPGHGRFLARTQPMHPEICGYISAEFYEGRLEPAGDAPARSTPFGAGLRLLAVESDGRREESPEEAARIAEQVERLLAGGVASGEILVTAGVAPQIALLRDALPADVRVEALEDLRDQNAEVVLYSMVYSDEACLPRGTELVLVRNRLNVAISRARCLAYLACSPRLLDLNARSIPQLRLANALCRFAELARPG